MCSRLGSNPSLSWNLPVIVSVRPMGIQQESELGSGRWGGLSPSLKPFPAPQASGIAADWFPRTRAPTLHLCSLASAFRSRAVDVLYHSAFFHSFFLMKQLSTESTSVHVKAMQADYRVFKSHEGARYATKGQRERQAISVVLIID